LGRTCRIGDFASSQILIPRLWPASCWARLAVKRAWRRHPEICAIVDHEKLDHSWLWEMVGAKVRKDVDQMSMFGDEDLPPKRKPQFVAKPELLIDLPQPIEEDEGDFGDDLDDVENRFW